MSRRELVEHYARTKCSGQRLRIFSWLFKYRSVQFVHKSHSLSIHFFFFSFYSCYNFKLWFWFDAIVKIKKKVKQTTFWKIVKFRNVSLTRMADNSANGDFSFPFHEVRSFDESYFVLSLCDWCIVSWDYYVGFVMGSSWIFSMNFF